MSGRYCQLPALCDILKTTIPWHVRSIVHSRSDNKPADKLTNAYNYEQLRHEINDFWQKDTEYERSITDNFGQEK